MAAKGSWIRISARTAHLDAITIKAIIKDELGRKAISVTQKPELRQAIGEEFLKAVTPFVPMNTGALRESGRATDDGRLYWTAVRPANPENENSYAYNYAKYAFDPDKIFWPNGEYNEPRTEGTYPRWVEKVHPGTPEWEAFVNNILPIIKEALEND
jgi:hypothetical protein